MIFDLRLKIFTFLIVSFLFLVSGLPVSAHLAGQPPYFKVNEKYSPLYPVPTTSIADFPLPQDAGPENYIIGQVINFEIDPTKLAVPPEIVAKTTFSWDFGDGGIGQGLKNNHAYTKPGSYLLKIYAQYDQISGNQLFQSILLNVLPDANYQLPKAKILINGKSSRDALSDTLKFEYGQKLDFDASQSTAASKIVSYFWDFGDSQSVQEAKTTHTYSKDLPQQQVFPVLRVKDQNGLIGDAFVEVDNKKGIASLGVSSQQSASLMNPLILAAIGAILVLGIVSFLGRKKGR